jgi:hypothetical protein
MKQKIAKYCQVLLIIVFAIGMFMAYKENRPPFSSITKKKNNFRHVENYNYTSSRTVGISSNLRRH